MDIGRSRPSPELGQSAFTTASAPRLHSGLRRHRRGKATPLYLDSKTTIFVATSDAAARNSVWLMRRTRVVREGVDMNEALPKYISEALMRADPFTKYLVYLVWARHMRYVHNEL